MIKLEKNKLLNARVVFRDDGKGRIYIKQGKATIVVNFYTDEYFLRKEEKLRTEQGKV